MLYSENKMFVPFGNIVRKSLAKGTSTCTAPLLFLIAYSGAHRLEKYLNLEGFLEKSLKNKSALNTAKSLKVVENSPRILPFTGGFNSVFET